MTNEMNTEVEQPVPEKPSLFGMIMNPREQLEKIRVNPKVLIALIIVTVLTVVGMLLMLNGIDFMDDPALSGMSEEEMMMVTLVSQIGFVITGIFTPIFGILLVSVGHFIVAKIVSSEAKFKQLFSMNTYIFIISTIGVLLNGLVFMFIGGAPETLFTSLNSIIGAEGMLGAFLNSIEIFAIWSMIVTAMGLQIVARFNKGLAWAVVIVFYIIGIVFQLISAGLNTMMGV